MRFGRIALAAALVAFAAQTAGAGDSCKYGTQECLDYMATKMKNSGWVGVELDGEENEVGMTVTLVVNGSPAEEAGIQVGDVLVAINDIQLTDANHEKLGKAREEWKPGSAVTWTMTRDEAERDLNLTLAPMPADVLARWIGSHMLEHAEVEIASSE